MNENVPQNIKNEQDLLEGWLALIAIALESGHLTHVGRLVTLTSQELTLADLEGLSPSEPRNMRERS